MAIAEKETLPGESEIKLFGSVWLKSLWQLISPVLFLSFQFHFSWKLLKPVTKPRYKNTKMEKNEENSKSLSAEASVLTPVIHHVENNFVYFILPLLLLLRNATF